MRRSFLLGLVFGLWRSVLGLGLSSLGLEAWGG